MNYLTSWQHSSRDEVYASNLIKWYCKVLSRGRSLSLEAKPWTAAFWWLTWAKPGTKHTTPGSFPFQHLPASLPTRGHYETHFNLSSEVSTGFPLFHVYQAGSPHRATPKGLFSQDCDHCRLPHSASLLPPLPPTCKIHQQASPHDYSSA